MELIALTGARGSGKNTAALGIKQWSRGRGLAYAERGFADMLKWSAARLFWPDISREKGIAWANSIKQGDDHQRFMFYQSFTTYGADGDIQSEVYDAEVTGRQLLQRYGTESHRDIFGENFWVDQLLPLQNPHDDPDPETPEWWWNFTGDPVRTNHGKAIVMPDFNVITDLRFENEAERVKELGGVIWEIHRPGYGGSDAHASEQPLPRELVDKVFPNDKTVAALIEEIEHAMDNDYHLKYLVEDPA